MARGPSGKAPQPGWPELRAQSISPQTTEGVPAATATPTATVKSWQLCPRGHLSQSYKQLQTRTVVAPRSDAGQDTEPPLDVAKGVGGTDFLPRSPRHPNLVTHPRLGT